MTIVTHLANPEQQFCDANGHPYAGGTLHTYVSATTTPKTTYTDMAGGSANANPIVLDAAGRCVMFGDGLYRLVLKDASGNQIWDQNATTIVSAAMAPVVIAATIADALALLGIDPNIASDLATETARAIAAEGVLSTALGVELAAREAADATLTTNLAAEVTRAEAEEATLQGEIDTINAGLGAGTAGTRAGAVTSDSGANFTITFSPPFATDAVYATVVDKALVPNSFVTSTLTRTTWSGMIVDPITSAGVPMYPVEWWAVGFLLPLMLALQYAA